MIEYRAFRNTDPPLLADLWQASAGPRNLVRPMSVYAWEDLVLSKPYFDRKGFLVAANATKMIGFVHAGFGPTGDLQSLSTESGVVSMVMVRPEYRRQGVGSSLLKLAEQYLVQAGASQMYAGESRPLNPFYLGLYRGSGAAAVLDSLPGAGSFFAAHHYTPRERSIVWERDLSDFVAPMDRSSVRIRRSTRLEMTEDPISSLWWEACTYGQLEQYRFDLIARPGGECLATAQVCALEPLAASWGVRAVLVRYLEVEPAHRRRGVATFLLSEIFRRMRELGVTIVQVETLQSNQAGIALCRRLKFQQVDSGVLYHKCL